MEYHLLGKTGFNISALSLGTWQVGGQWGSPFQHDRAQQILHAAVDAGVNFIDTADVYGDGESERAVGKFIRSRSERIYVATKCGRRLSPHVNASYTPAALRNFVEDSLRHMQLETIDLIQLHCPPTEVYSRPEIFELFTTLRQEGKIQHLGVSVEKISEGLQAITYPQVATVQIIFNMFRLKPAALFFQEAAKQDVGIIARVPLASGLLTGAYSKDTSFSENDHRHFNRDGAAFDKGETFSGIDYDTGLAAVEALKDLFPDQSLAQVALRWILMFPEVSTVIPGASSPQQAQQNVKALEIPALTGEQMAAVQSVYDRLIKPAVHHLW